MPRGAPRRPLRRLAAAAAALLWTGAAAPGASEELLPLDLPPKLLELDFPVQTQYLALKQALETELAAEEPNRRRLARAYGEMGMWFDAYNFSRLAEPAYRNARLLAPNDRRWPYYLAHIYEDWGEMERSRDAFAAALALAPDDLPTMIHLTEAEISAGNLERARELADRVLEKRPRMSVALAQRGRIALAEGDAAAAAALLERALEGREDPSLHWVLGMAYRNLGEMEKANEHLAKGAEEGFDRNPLLLVNDPLKTRLYRLQQGARVHARRGRRALRHKRYDEALEHFEKAVVAAPDKPTHRINVATTLMAADRHAEALEVLEEALARGWNEAEIRYRIGRCHDHLGRPEEAEAEYRAALSIDARHARANALLGSRLMGDGRTDEALPYLLRAVEVDPRKELPRIYYVTALLETGRIAEAARAAGQSVLAQPDSRRLQLLQARILAAAPDGALRDGARSLALAEAALAQRASALAAETLAMAHAESGNFERALAWQRAVLAVAESSPVSRQRLARYERAEPCRTPWVPGEWSLDAVKVERPPG